MLYSRFRQENRKVGLHSRAGRQAARALLFGFSLLLVFGAACHLAGKVRLARSRKSFEAVASAIAPLQHPRPGVKNPSTDPSLQPILEALEMPPFDVGEPTPWSRSRRDWTAEMEGKARLVLQLNAQALASLIQITTEDSNFRLPPLGLEGSDLLNVLRMPNLLNLKAQLAFAEADTEHGVQALRIQARIVALLQENPALISALVGAATAQLVDRVVIDAVRLGDFWAADPQILGELQGLVPEIPFESLMAAAGRDQVRYTKREVRISRLIRFLVGSWVVAEAYDEGRRVLDAIAQPLVAALPAEDSDSHWQDAWSWSARPLSALQQSRAFAVHFVDQATAELRGDTLVGPLEGWLLHSAGKLQWSASRRQLARAALLMRQIGLRERRYPGERPDLPVLTDPVAFTGRRLTYSLLPDGSLRLGQAVSEEELMSLYLVSEGDELAKARILGSETLWVDLPTPG